MKRRKYLTVLCIFAALIVAMVAIFPVSANEPLIFRSHYEEDGTLPLCDIDMQYQYQYNLKYTFLCDEKDKLCGDSYIYTQSIFSITNTNSGNTLTLRTSRRERYTWITYEETIIDFSGRSHFGTIPGHGPVSGFAGKEIYYETCYFDENDEWACEEQTLHFSGIEFPSDYEVICNYLLYGE